MRAIPFLAIFAEEVEPTEIEGEYDSKLQMLMDANTSSPVIFMSTSTHTYTSTNGYNDVDTDSSED